MATCTIFVFKMYDYYKTIVTRRFLYVIIFSDKNGVYIKNGFNKRKEA